MSPGEMMMPAPRDSVYHYSWKVAGAEVVENWNTVLQSQSSNPAGIIAFSSSTSPQKKSTCGIFGVGVMQTKGI